VGGVAAVSPLAAAERDGGLRGRIDGADQDAAEQRRGAERDGQCQRDACAEPGDRLSRCGIDRSDWRSDRDRPAGKR